MKQFQLEFTQNQHALDKAIQNGDFSLMKTKESDDLSEVFKAMVSLFTVKVPPLYMKLYDEKNDKTVDILEFIEDIKKNSEQLKMLELLKYSNHKMIKTIELYEEFILNSQIDQEAFKEFKIKNFIRV